MVCGYERGAGGEVLLFTATQHLKCSYGSLVLLLGNSVWLTDVFCSVTMWELKVDSPRRRCSSLGLGLGIGNGGD